MSLTKKKLKFYTTETIGKHNIILFFNLFFLISRNIIDQVNLRRLRQKVMN